MRCNNFILEDDLSSLTELKKYSKKYYQLVYAIDVAFGMIRKELEQQGAAENTAIIYTSDNGYMCGSHGYGGKVIPMEESSRVPLMIYDPRIPNKKRHVKCDALAGNIDIAPTILDLAGVAVPENLYGTSLMPLISGKEKEIHESMAFMNDWGPVSCTRLTVLQKDWKYTYWWYRDEKMEPFEELFNTKVDPPELVNFAKPGKEKMKLEEMRGRYDRQVAFWKENAVTYNDYKRFGILFHRNIPFEEKKHLLEKSNKK